ncbi:hypothetical protein PV325_004668 [Microctonus aethiopoides]|uniref:GYF domain-containing protein n=1 Tax=Microctonus aethiopoides TaxID=144406 RepID=A0AA39EZJ1_9HYME|nr:hypothetical protein PV325_004668 [Microctonus aethiopoides]KAK0160034.1 hypothetical protein PV328_007480 [Microctonus aethiopoides]
MSKRKYDDVLSDEKTWSSHQATRDSVVKNSLDSEEEDDEANEDNYNIMHEDDIEGVEDGPVTSETNVGFTAFNMKEELEEGHFDKEGHYLWNKEKEIRDNWLDNIDWVKVKPKTGAPNEDKKMEDEEKGLGESDSEDDTDLPFDATQLYKNILEYLQPGETVSKALCRLGKGKKPISSAERWKRKKAGLSEIDENSEKIMKLTELANELLTRTGNMDIYQESYDLIKKKINLSGKQSHPSKQEAELDMYSDDFDVKEKKKLDIDDEHPASASSQVDKNNEANSIDDNTKASDIEVVTWELKWSENDNAEISGPHTTEQMYAWSSEGYFKKGAWVRRTGQEGRFYSALRVDFELYI